MIFGILSGFAAATFQSGGYILARIYIKKRNDPLELMVIAQLLIALFSICCSGATASGETGTGSCRCV